MTGPSKDWRVILVSQKDGQEDLVLEDGLTYQKARKAAGDMAHGLPGAIIKATNGTRVLGVYQFSRGVMD